MNTPCLPGVHWACCSCCSSVMLVSVSLCLYRFGGLVGKVSATKVEDRDQSSISPDELYQLVL